MLVSAPSEVWFAETFVYTQCGYFDVITVVIVIVGLLGSNYVYGIIGGYQDFFCPEEGGNVFF